MAGPTLGHFQFSEDKMANVRQIPGRRGKGGGVVTLGIDWDITEIDFKSNQVTSNYGTGGGDRSGGRWKDENLFTCTMFRSHQRFSILGSLRSCHGDGNENVTKKRGFKEVNKGAARAF